MAVDVKAHQALREELRGLPTVPTVEKKPIRM